MEDKTSAKKKPKSKKKHGDKQEDEKQDIPEIEKSSLSLDVEKQEEFEERLRKISQLKLEDDKLTPGVIYLGHIPHGFFENQLRSFFGQFGTVNRVRLSRSRKTGNSKGYAFIEFACEEVAKIAAETMDKYMMFGRLLKCHFLPQEKIHPRLWKGANRTFCYVDRNKNSINEHNKARTKEEHEKQVNRLVRREKRKRAKLTAAGIDYDFPGYVADAKTRISKHIKFDEGED